jgi:hypothetical protein
MFKGRSSKRAPATTAKPNAQYNMAAPDSLPQRIASHQRRAMYRRFLEETGVTASETILDVGVTSDRAYESSNYLEAWYPNTGAITAAGIDDARFLEELYPGVKFKYADGLDLPFEDLSFDVVHSSAVLEHVGSRDNQARFISECARVARRAVFLTTPNRWFPMELHTVLPVVHWLPPPLFRAALRRTRFRFSAFEKNLNLLSSSDLRRLVRSLEGFEFRVSGVTVAGWTSNLLLIGHRVPGDV